MLQSTRFIVTAILLFAASASHPETLTSKDWIVNTDQDEFYYAATTNEAGHILGQFCYFGEDSCVYIVGMGITCKKGHKYPAMINSDAGALSVELVCADKVNEQNVLLISPFDDIDSLVRAGSKMGVVIPMEGDRFKVSRFSLIGSTYAIDLLRAAAKYKMNRTPVKSIPPDEEYI